MARSRNIKPGFFVNADLVELPSLVRLLFIGLWTIADRKGRLEDRPSQIKMQILPGDDIDTGQALDKLDASGFIRRYSVGGKGYIEIVNFEKHQNPHMKEPQSIIPPPEATPEVAEIKEENASTMRAPCEHFACLVLAGLIPDSLNLIPDSLKKKEKEGDKSPLETIFSVGVKILTDAGVSNRNARSILGKYTKQDKEKLAGIIGQMSLLNPVDPVAYLTKAMQPKKREFVE